MARIDERDAEMSCGGIWEEGAVGSGGSRGVEKVDEKKEKGGGVT